MQSVQIPGTQDDKAENHKQDITENEFGDQCFFHPFTSNL